jgi:ABC-type phosphate transport system substrate-binding protein
VALRGMLAVVLLVASAAAAHAKDLALVANKANGLAEISMPELVKVCKAQMSKWPDGKPMTFVMRNPASAEAKLVLEKVYAMTPEAVDALVTSANHERANHPAIVVVSSDDELVRRVASTPGAIGLVDVYSINSSVQVVKIAGKLPLEPGYALHGN